MSIRSPLLRLPLIREWWRAEEPRSSFPNSDATSPVAVRSPARLRARGGAHDPGAEGLKCRLVTPALAIDQIPVLAFRHRLRERRDQPARVEVVVDIGADAHGDADAVGGRLQRLAVKFELRPPGANL